MVPKFVHQPYLCPNMRLSSTRRCRNIAAKEMLTTASSAESQAHSQSSQKHPQHFVLSELISRKGMSFHRTCYHHWIPLNSTLGSVYVLEKLKTSANPEEIIQDTSFWSASPLSPLWPMPSPPVLHQRMEDQHLAVEGNQMTHHD